MSMMPITAAMVLSSKNLWEQAHSCIQSLPVRIALEQAEETGTEALLDRLDRHRVDVVLVEAGHLTLPLEEFVRRLKNSATQPAVFVLHTEASPELILEALRAGAAEFLYSPLEDKLREAFERLSHTRAKSGAGRSAGLGKIFGVISAKGGCGATTVACHLATDMSKILNPGGGSKVVQTRVLLADMDFEAGLTRFVMKTNTTYTVRDAIDNLHRMDSNYWKALISTHSNCLDVIPSPDEVAVKHLPSPDQTMHLMRFVRSTYPGAIVDFGRCISHVALDALPELEAMYVVTTLDLQALAQARRAIENFEQKVGSAAKVRILLNKIPERNSPDLKAIERMVGSAPAALLTSDVIGLYDAYSEGRLVDGGSRLGREMKGLAATLVRRVQGEAETAELADKSGKSSPKTEAAGTKKWFSFLQRSAAKEKHALQGKDGSQ